MLPTHLEFEGKRIALKYHRLLSGSGQAPPNSLAALREVVEGGAWALEFDVRLLGDGTFVLHHDPTLERETTGQGPLRALDRRAYKALRLRGYDEPPATLAEAVAYLGRVTRPLKVQVDLKEEFLTPEAALGFLRTLEPLRANPAMRLVVGSLADWNLRLLKRLDPGLAIGFDPAFYLDAPAGEWARLPVRVNAYGYLDDHPLGFRRFLPTVAYLEDRLEALLRSVPPFQELYLRKEFLVQALADGVDPVAFARRLLGRVWVDVWTLNPWEEGFRGYLEAALVSGVDQITTDTPLGLMAVSPPPGGPGGLFPG
ncbi:MAG: glycerophosphodiester phosphodiesterase [Thermus sp.]|uniref:glycerophosphodiester phosphodiesterase n=1 Tax=Thermus sp. TaxID=275 RepID=UPI00351AE3B1